MHAVPEPIGTGSVPFNKCGAQPRCEGVVSTGELGTELQWHRSGGSGGKLTKERDTLARRVISRGQQIKGKTWVAETKGQKKKRGKKKEGEEGTGIELTRPACPGSPIGLAA